ncbi:mitochondrial inner membrane protein OXA1-like [Malania oleifera]|uniref:mitochondrial inner membrane protein OXA1-like n=1 Tax=Malania oleifera TaxID=397392 RepID=UPI0025AE1D1E|nr:mitochondrial inner membrane protein OXA1-like [Malania oleifera]
MAYTRSITTRASLLARRCHASISYALHDDDRKQHSLDEDLSQKKINTSLCWRYCGSSINNSAGLASFMDRRRLPFTISPSVEFASCRYMSTTIGEGSDKIEYMSDVAGVLSDTTVDAVASQAPAVSEVAVAAADSFFPVAALQYLIDGVHSFTGLNWWASIAITTILIRGATVPLLINQLKTTSKLTLMRPRLEEIKQQIQDAGMDPTAVAEGQKRMQAIFKEYGVTPFSPLKGLFIQGPIFVSFYIAITNMVEKVPSFKGGGAFWFTDLTTPDSLYVFPVLTGLTFLITVECNAQEGLEGNPVAKTMKNVCRGLAVATVFFTQNFPKAIFCYWVTSNLFSLMYGLVIKRPEVKKFFGIPEIPVAPATTASQPAFSWPALKRSVAVTQEASSTQVEPAKIIERKISSSSIMSQRLRSLEKQVKGRKKGKKR